MIQPGREGQILLWGLLTLICGAFLLVFFSGNASTLAIGVLLVAGGALSVPLSLISKRKG